MNKQIKAVFYVTLKVIGLLKGIKRYPLLIKYYIFELFCVLHNPMFGGAITGKLQA